MAKTEVRRRKRNTVLAALELYRAAHPEGTLLQFALLLYALENPAIAVLDLCRLANATASNGSRAIAELVDAGLLTLLVSPTDRRVKLVAPTPAAEQIRQGINHRISQARPILYEDSAAEAS